MAEAENDAVSLWIDLRTRSLRQSRARIVRIAAILAILPCVSSLINILVMGYGDRPNWIESLRYALWWCIGRFGIPPWDIPFWCIAVGLVSIMCFSYLGRVLPDDDCLVTPESARLFTRLRAFALWGMPRTIAFYALPFWMLSVFSDWWSVYLYFHQHNFEFFPTPSFHASDMFIWNVFSQPSQINVTPLAFLCLASMLLALQAIRRRKMSWAFAVPWLIFAISYVHPLAFIRSNVAMTMQYAASWLLLLVTAGLLVAVLVHPVTRNRMPASWLVQKP